MVVLCGLKLVENVENLSDWSRGLIGRDERTVGSGRNENE